MIPEPQREALGDVFRAALLERDGAATQKQQLDASAKARRAPCLLLAVVDLTPRDKSVPDVERKVSLGALSRTCF